MIRQADAAFSPFVPAWWLPGAHLPTIWAKRGRRQPTVHDRIERVATPDSDHLTLLRMGVATDQAPHLLVLHGLEGTMHAKYAHGLLASAKRRGWTGDLMMFRTCDGEMNAARRMYHSGETGDVDFIARRIVAERHGQPVFVVGVSLGGNVLLKWLAELGGAATGLVKGAVAMSVPADLAAGSRYLEHGLGPLYVRHFLNTLKPKAYAKDKQYPGCIDIHRVRDARSFWDFDDAATAPLHGFRSAADYYSRSSSLPLLPLVQVPSAVLVAQDDPFIPPPVIGALEDVARTSAVISVHTTRRGGHVGWVSGGPLAPTYPMEDKSIAFLERLS
jgi:predicted alpha/beta-fold hydrolase